MLMFVAVRMLPTFRVNITVVEPMLLVAVNETVDELVPDGVPLRIPVRAFSVSPRFFSVESVVLDAESVAVSYTHLDVYKRQKRFWSTSSRS